MLLSVAGDAIAIPAHRERRDQGAVGGRPSRGRQWWRSFPSIGTPALPICAEQGHPHWSRVGDEIASVAPRSCMSGATTSPRHDPVFHVRFPRRSAIAGARSPPSEPNWILPWNELPCSGPRRRERSRLQRLSVHAPGSWPAGSRSVPRVRAKRRSPRGAGIRRDQRARRRLLRGVEPIFPASSPGRSGSVSVRAGSVFPRGAHGAPRSRFHRRQLRAQYALNATTPISRQRVPFGRESGETRTSGAPGPGQRQRCSGFAEPAFRTGDALGVRPAAQAPAFDREELAPRPRAALPDRPALRSRSSSRGRASRCPVFDIRSNSGPMLPAFSICSSI